MQELKHVSVESLHEYVLHIDQATQNVRMPASPLSKHFSHWCSVFAITDAFRVFCLVHAWFVRLAYKMKP
jgi:hypothetical protein